MIDLTPLDVRKKRGDFRRLLRGYDPEEVDTFMDLVAERFEELVRENLALSEKTGRLEIQVQALEGREHAVQEALVTAQKLREDVRSQSQRDADVLNSQARREAEILKAEAESEIGRRLAEAESLILGHQRALEDLERSRLKFLKSFRGLLERELDAVEVEETRRPFEDIPLELELRGWMPAGSEDAEAEAEVEVEDEVEDEAEAEAEDEVEAEIEPELESVIAVPEAPIGLSPGPKEDFLAVEDAEEAGETGEEKVPSAEYSWPVTDNVGDPVPEAEIAWEDEVESEVALDGEVEPEVALDGEVEDEVDRLIVAVVDDEIDEKRTEEGIPGGFETQVLEGAFPAGTTVDSDAAPPAQERKPSPSSQEPKWLFSLLKKENEERGGEG